MRHSLLQASFGSAFLFSTVYAQAAASSAAVTTAAATSTANPTASPSAIPTTDSNGLLDGPITLGTPSPTSCPSTTGAVPWSTSISKIPAALEVPVYFNSSQGFKTPNATWTVSTDTPGVNLSVGFNYYNLNFPPAFPNGTSGTKVSFVTNDTMGNVDTGGDLLLMIMGQNSSGSPATTEGYSITMTADLPCQFNGISGACTQDAFTGADLSPSTWVTLGVDEYLKWWVSENWSDNSTGDLLNLQQTFLNGIGRGTTQLCDPSSTCDYVDVCSDLDNIKNNPNVTQIFLVLKALANVNNMFNIWQSGISNAQNDLNSLTDTITTTFYKVPPPKATLASLTNLLGFFFTFIGAASNIIKLATSFADEIGAGANVLAGLAAGTNGIGIGAGFATGGALPNVEYNFGEASEYGNAIVQMKYGLLNMTNDAYQHILVSPPVGAPNVLNMLSGGVFCDDGLSNTLGSTSSNDYTSAADQMSSFIEQLMFWQVLNGVWQLDGQWILYVPYGDVYASDFYDDCQGEPTFIQFDQARCQSDWANNTRAVVLCQDPVDSTSGMLLLQSINLSMDKSALTPSFNISGYDYNANDILTGSYNTYQKFGFGGNITSIIANDFTTNNTAAATSDLGDLDSYSATSPGIFTFPLCKTYQYGSISSFEQLGCSNDLMAPCNWGFQACFDPVADDPVNHQPWENYIGPNLASYASAPPASTTTAAPVPGVPVAHCSTNNASPTATSPAPPPVLTVRAEKTPEPVAAGFIGAYRRHERDVI